MRVRRIWEIMEKTDDGYRLNRALWRDGDRAEFVAYVNSLGGGREKAAFEQKIMNTKYPCIGVPSPDVEKIVREIAKGNYTSFIDLWITDNYTCLVIVGKLIARIKDFSTLKRYLDEYIKLVDCWGGCDCLKFNITKGNGDEFFALARELTKSENPFGRRIGLVIMLKMIDEKYIGGVLETCRSLSAETHYYVNMANAWLVSECFVRQRDKTLKLIQSGELNKFVQNKAISKCRDSYRVTADDKELLKRYKKQTDKTDDKLSD